MKIMTPLGEAELVVVVPPLPMAELDLMEKAADRSGNVTTASTLRLAANKMRQSATFINDSDEVIYLRLGQTATLNTGIRLNAVGGAYEIGKANLWKGDVFAIHGGTGNKVLCIEEIESRHAY